jgi:hypothetical protein
VPGNTESKVRKGRLKLPAIAAVPAISTIAAPTSATAAAISTIAAPASATAAITAAAPTATRTLRLWTGFVHNQIPAAKILTVQAGNCAIRFFIVGDFDERESARLPRETITNQTDGRRIDSQLPEPLLQLLFGSTEGEITDVKLLHLRTPSARNLE